MNNDISLAKKIDPKGMVVQLDEKRRFELPAIDKPSNVFLVNGETLYAVDHFGPLKAYSLGTEKRNHISPCSIAYFEQSRIKQIATDGDYIYPALQLDFKMRSNDRLLARINKDENVPEIEIIGKELLYLDKGPFPKHDDKEDGEAAGIGLRIIPIPFDHLRKSIIFGADRFRSRFLVPKEFTGIGSCCELTSREGYVKVFLRHKDDEEYYPNATAYLRNGKLHWEDDNNSLSGEIADILEKEKQMPLTIYDFLRVGESRHNETGLEIHLDYIDEEKALQDPDRNEWVFIPMKVDFTQGRPTTMNSIDSVIGVQKKGKDVYVLKSQREFPRSNKDHKERSGVIDALEPAELIHYEMSLREISNKPFEG